MDKTEGIRFTETAGRWNHEAKNHGMLRELKGIYGYRRVKVWLNRIYGIHINHKRVRRTMGELKIKASIRRKRPYYGKKEAYVISGII
ncbi:MULTISPECIES: IS3 family transposase [Paenibacillus]|uniref:IS3 family transposase n=1 Tax=Paenibacillus TaxID=44249 RepID=UPI00117F9CEB|nr:IS3 family transposase [Paenibacillus peoriae]